MVAIIDYGMGNVASVQKALNFLKVKNIITDDLTIISKSKCIILPGVGSFAQGMENLRKKNLEEVLNEMVLEKNIPFLGICLGMQLIIENGTEPVDCKGLGWIKGSVVKLDAPGLAVPHLGWNDITVSQPAYFNDIADKDYYFIHSYHMLPEEKSVIAATVNYGKELVAAVRQNNIFATQFHPEKSQNAGLMLLKNFFEANA